MERGAAEIRREDGAHASTIHALHVRAFGGRDEADIVDRLRRAANPFVSLVACQHSTVVGHICFSPITIGDPAHDIRAMGLAPMGVLPEFQNRGIGAQLIRAGLDACQAEGQQAVFVLGHPSYYPRFGFVPAEPLGLICEYPCPPEAWMVLELEPGCLGRCAGVVRYHRAFHDATV